jgi:hypothetical protein
MKVSDIIAKEICDYLYKNRKNEFSVTIHLWSAFFIHTKDGS